MGSNISKSSSKSAAKQYTRPANLEDAPSEAPFPKKDPSCTDILIRSEEQGFGTSRNLNDKPEVLMDALIKAYGGQKAIAIRTNRFRGQGENTSVVLPGFRVIAMGPRMYWSRMRNRKADAWFEQAYETADGFAYTVNIKSTVDHYLTCGDYSGWERDRAEISRLLRRPSLVENPKKPFLLLVGYDNACITEDDLGLDRLVNLFGLGGRLGRPFRSVSYSSSAPDEDELKEALEWLRKTAGSPDEATAMTECETEEENSVVTNTSTLFADDDNAGAYILDYDPTFLGGNPTLQRFERIKKGTHCPFARSAKLWGGKLMDEHKPRLNSEDRFQEIQEAASLNAGPLAEFVARSKDGESLDGFCLEIPRSGYLKPDLLGESVRHLLTRLASLDPAPGENSMKMGPIDQPHWRFRFAGEDFFITTFSPVYQKDSSRHSFGASQAFMLFQPMESFGRHGLTEDTPASATNWSNPTSMRDKARVAFKENGCPYHIPEELPYPVAEHIVKPQKDDGTAFIRWWEPLDAK